MSGTSRRSEQSTSNKSKAQARTENHFGSEGEGALAEALKVNTTLTALQLRGQNGTMAAPQHDVLVHDKRWHKQTDIEGVSGALQEALLVNTALTELVWA